MSRSLNGNKTGSFDIVDLTEWSGALTIQGYEGTAGQVLKKNPTTNKIEWGADTPGNLSVVAPILLTGNQLSLDDDFGSQSITTTGNFTATLITANNNIIANNNIVGNGATTLITGINTISTIGLLATGDITANGNIVGDGSTNINSMNDINCVNVNATKLTTSGNVVCNGNIEGDTNTNISDVDNISCISLNVVNNIQAFGDINGDTTTDINAIKDINSATLTTSGDIVCNGDIRGDGSTQIRDCDLKFFNNELPGQILYPSITDNCFVRIFTPTEFMSDNDSANYNRTTIADTGQNGAAQTTNVTQKYAMFNIPYGYKWTKYFIKLTNSAGTNQNGGSSVWYAGAGYKTTSGTNLTMIHTGYPQFNTTHTLSTPITSGWTSSFKEVDFDDIKYGVLMPYRNQWNTTYYLKGAYVVFEKV